MMNRTLSTFAQLPKLCKHHNQVCPTQVNSHYSNKGERRNCPEQKSLEDKITLPFKPHLAQPSVSTGVLGDGVGAVICILAFRDASEVKGSQVPLTLPPTPTPTIWVRVSLEISKHL